MTTSIFEYEAVSHLEILEQDSIDNPFDWVANGADRSIDLSAPFAKNIDLGLMDIDHIEQYIASSVEKIITLGMSAKFIIHYKGEGSIHVQYIGNGFNFMGMAACSGNNLTKSLRHYEKQAEKLALYCNQSGTFWIMRFKKGIALL